VTSPTVPISQTALTTGASSQADAAAAGRTAVDRALGGLRPVTGDVVFVYADSDYDPGTVFDAASEVAGAATVVGLSAAGGITEAGIVQGGVVAALLTAGDTVISVAGVGNADVDPYTSTLEVCRKVRQDALSRVRPHDALLLLTDGYVGDQREIVRGAYEITGARVPIVGGVASEKVAERPTAVYVGGTLYDRGLAALWISSPRPLGVGVEHGWRPAGRAMLITGAHGNVITELDGRPALPTYLEMVEQSKAEHRTDVGAYEALVRGRVTDRPFGMPNARGGYDIRHVMRVTDEGLELFGYLPDQGVVRIMAATPVNLLDGARNAAEMAVGQLGRPPRALFVFDCVGRRDALQEQIHEEVSSFVEVSGGAPMIGLFTYGEFARVTGSTGFHNATVAVLAL
jgi:hypothetical protein